MTRALNFSWYESEGAYLVAKPYYIYTDMKDCAFRYETSTGFVRLSENGRLTIMPKYAWDGPSGPALDFANRMEASCVHDALYEAIRRRKLHPSYRKKADEIYRDILGANGMGWWRWVHPRSRPRG